MRFSSVDALFEAPPRPRNNKGTPARQFQSRALRRPSFIYGSDPSWTAIMASHRTSSIGQY